MTFRTTLCDLLDIEYPIVQSGMGAIAGPDLVVEVCRAGGLGILAGLNVPPDDLRKMMGTLDLLNALFQGNRLQVQLGAAYYIPTVAVPALLVTHAMIFMMLVTRSRH